MKGAYLIFEFCIFPTKRSNFDRTEVIFLWVKPLDKVIIAQGKLNKLLLCSRYLYSELEVLNAFDCKFITYTRTTVEIKPGPLQEINSSYWTVCVCTCLFPHKHTWNFTYFNSARVIDGGVLYEQ